MSVIYRASRVLTMAAAGVIADAEVLVDGDIIREVGQGIVNAHPDIPVRDMGNAAILPGFVNAHSHLEPTFRKNFADGLNLWNWLDCLGFSRQKTPSYELLLASARLGAAECLKSGITCLGDCSFSGAASQVMSSVGLRGISYKEVFGQSMGEDYKEKLNTAVQNILQMRSSLPGRVLVGMSPHSIYTSGIDMLKYCAETCADHGIPIAVHVAETRAESEYTMKGTGPIAKMRKDSFGYEPMITGMRPLQVLKSAGLLRKDTILAHCVHFNDDEIDSVASSGASVAHCPRSNAYLGAGVAQLNRMRQFGIGISLGTDSAASCLRLDFFEEMRFALGLHRAIAEDAGVLSAKDVLKLATKGGADALGMGDVIGRLEPGMRADLIAVDLTGTLPGEDVHLSVITRTPNDIILRLIDGSPVEPDIDSMQTELQIFMERWTRE